MQFLVGCLLLLYHHHHYSFGCAWITQFFFVLTWNFSIEYLCMEFLNLVCMCESCEMYLPDRKTTHSPYTFAFVDNSVSISHHTLDIGLMLLYLSVCLGDGDQRKEEPKDSVQMHLNHLQEWWKWSGDEQREIIHTHNSKIKMNETFSRQYFFIHCDA